MTENKVPVLTKEQASFLLDLELDTYAKKARAIAKAARELTFEDQWDEDNFHDAIRQGYWDVQTNYYFINVLAPLGQVSFISESEFTHPTTAKKVYEITDDFTKATRFSTEELEDLSTKDALYPYKQGDFLVSEYSAVMKYGDISEWLKGNQTEENSDEVVETEELVVVVQPHPEWLKENQTEENSDKVVETEEPTPEEVSEPHTKQLKHARGIISLK
jgi:hypothetical protein